MYAQPYANEAHIVVHQPVIYVTAGPVNLMYVPWPKFDTLREFPGGRNTGYTERLLGCNLALELPDCVALGQSLKVSNLLTHRDKSEQQLAGSKCSGRSARIRDGVCVRCQNPVLENQLIVKSAWTCHNHSFIVREGNPATSPLNPLFWPLASYLRNSCK